MKSQIMEHVLYEIEMFLLSYIYLVENEKKLGMINETTCAEFDQEKVTREIHNNFYYECFLLHIRNLLEFFREKSQKDSIVVGSIVKEPYPFHFNDKDGKAHEFVCKTVTHLSKLRIDEKKIENLKTYALSIVPDLLIFIKSFLLILSDETKLRDNIAEELEDKVLCNRISNLLSLVDETKIYNIFY